MIGGVEISLQTKAVSEPLVAAVQAIRPLWPQATFENGLTGERYPDFKDIPFFQIHELFVYRDADCANTWDAEGAVPAVFNTMIHLIPADDYLTIVVDKQDAVIEQIQAAIESALYDKILCIPAELEAA